MKAIPVICLWPDRHERLVRRRCWQAVNKYGQRVGFPQSTKKLATAFAKGEEE